MRFDRRVTHNRIVTFMLYGFTLSRGLFRYVYWTHDLVESVPPPMARILPRLEFSRIVS